MIVEVTTFLDDKLIILKKHKVITLNSRVACIMSV